MIIFMVENGLGGIRGRYFETSLTAARSRVEAILRDRPDAYDAIPISVYQCSCTPTGWKSFALDLLRKGHKALHWEPLQVVRQSKAEIEEMRRRAKLL